MKKQLLLTISILLSFTANSQNIADEIASYSEPKSELISKGRNFIADQITEGNFEKVTEAFIYLIDEFSNDKFEVFSMDELINLSVLTKQYSYALKAVAKGQIATKGYYFGNNQGFYTSSIAITQIDYLTTILENKVSENLIFIFNELENSELNFEEKSVLKLVLKKNILNTIFLTQYPEISQEKINTESTQFLTEFPNSTYSGYIRNFVRYEYVYPRGLGMDFGMGTSLFSDALQSNFQSPIVFTFGFEGYYKRHTLYLRAAFLGSKSRLEIAETPFQLPIPPTIPINFAIGELSYGYNILDGKKMNITPFAGIGLFEQSFGTNFIRKYPEYEPEHKNHFAYKAGINFDLNVFKDFTFDEAKIPLRIRISYVKPVTNSYTYLQGSMLNLSVGLAIKGWEQKRIY